MSMRTLRQLAADSNGGLSAANRCGRLSRQGGPSA
jgi:hypothetical protein